VRRIVMARLPAAGHVNPSVPLVGELVRRDIEVTYYTDEEFRAVVGTRSKCRMPPIRTPQPTVRGPITAAGRPREGCRRATL
jgi:UDP:flavonoid glycosyltransferase YjiC (YdhE family)